MLNEQTVERMRALKLGAMVAAWEGQQADPSAVSLSFDERLGLLIEAETLHRDNQRMTKAMRDARLKFPNACIEDVDCDGRGLERAVLRQLATGRWVREHQSVIVTGKTGTGKTYVACALAQQALRLGHRALYRRASRLYDELTLARADGTYGRLMDRIAKVHVLVIDDFALAPIVGPSRQDLLEVIDDRTGQQATIITSQAPTTAWHDYLGDPTVADAICDRLLHTAHKICLTGPSRRKREPSKESAS